MSVEQFSDVELSEVEHSIPSALILEDDFDLCHSGIGRSVQRQATHLPQLIPDLSRQENFRERLGNYLEEARSHDWNLMLLGGTGQNELLDL